MTDIRKPDDDDSGKGKDDRQGQDAPVHHRRWLHMGIQRGKHPGRQQQEHGPRQQHEAEMLSGSAKHYFCQLLAELSSASRNSHPNASPKRVLLSACP